MKNLLYLSLLLAGLLLISCGPDEEGGPSDNQGGDNSEDTTQMNVIVDDFTVVGKWYFQTVEAEGEVFGSAQADKDNSPSGFVLFEEDGTGIFDFGINLLAMDFGKIDSITWTRESNELVRIIESDGDINDWNLIRANEVLVEASWDITISDDNFATFTSVLTAEE